MSLARVAELIPCAYQPEREFVAQRLADAGLLITDADRAVLDAAEQWRAAWGSHPTESVDTIRALRDNAEQSLLWAANARHRALQR